MREVREQLWRAGKYAAVGIVVVVTLPVLLPSVFVLSVLLFTFVLPLVCAIAGFLYLHRHATMLYRYLPGAAAARRSSGSDSTHRSLPPPSRTGSFTLLELLRKDVESIDTFEVVDHEFDAVVVSKFGKVMTESPPCPDAVQRFESRKKETAETLQRDEQSQTTPSADNSDDYAESRRKKADREGSDLETRPTGALRGGHRKDEDEGEEEEEFRNAEDTSVVDDEHTEGFAASSVTSGAGHTREQDNGDGQFVGTVPNNSGACNLFDGEGKKAPKMAGNSDCHVATGEKGRVTESDLVTIPTGNIDDTLSKSDGENARESEGESFPETRFSKTGADPVASCTNSGEGVGQVQGLETGEKKNVSSETSDVNEDELATVSECSVDDITSEESCAVHPEVVSTEEGVSGLNSVSSSGACRPESAPASEMLRPDESASDHESFESTSDASFEAPQLEKELDFPDDEDHHSLQSRSLRGVEGFDGDDDDRDDSSLQDEDGYHYELHSEAPDGRHSCGEETAQTPNAVLGMEESCCIFSGSEEEASGPPSTTSHDSDASMETGGGMKGSRSALAFSEDMYDSEEQMHLQQVHDEEERQLREELKAIKEVVGDQEASKGPLVSDIEELSQILGIELPSMSDDIPELEWAKVAVEVMKVVVGME